MATHSNILAWKIPWTKEPGRLEFISCKETDTTEQLTLSHFIPKNSWDSWVVVYKEFKSWASSFENFIPVKSASHSNLCVIHKSILVALFTVGMCMQCSKNLKNVTTASQEPTSVFLQEAIHGNFTEHNYYEKSKLYLAQVPFTI